MFYKAPIPVAKDFKIVHQVSQRSLGEDHGAGPSENDPQQLIMKKKNFSWNGVKFDIKTPSGGRFGNNLYVRGKSFALIDEMVLLDGVTKEAIAVCRRKSVIFGEKVQIYSPKPLYHWQRPSGSSYMGRKLYTIAKVERSPLSFTHKVTYDNETSASMTITRTVSWWPRKRVVHRHGKTAAFIEGGTWTRNFNSYRVTINPGIDPCLIICLTAILR
ncbi:hypothetical protein IV203_011406 [Nitzschia inconspicua]|uniref:Uncharacterized protein n=1 Tax=Nitzschia inconspicua TaxID=303405 RepID=A0A9K3PKZ9_9STRA|nr:hypothetical protein IV203_011406 [Nitzschia inconspicua]